MTPNTDRQNQIAKVIRQILGLPLFVAMWLFAQFVKLRLWMKGY
jgi:hypothetical protein